MLTTDFKGLARYKKARQALINELYWMLGDRTIVIDLTISKVNYYRLSDSKVTVMRYAVEIPFSLKIIPIAHLVKILKHLKHEKSKKPGEYPGKDNEKKG